MKHFVVILSVLFSLQYAQAVAPVDERMKAMFIYNFSNFVQWPDSAFTSKNANLKICLYGNVPFSGDMIFFEGVPVRDRKLQFIITDERKDIESGCHILYVGIDQAKNLNSFFKNLNHNFVLSVGNVDEFVQQGGILNILRTSDQRKFEINLQKAQKNGLSMSSDLLELARIINQ
ncbi:YfiR family protein [Marinicellulosiphila megalodicopiae]|uniref:YfiR family protein n=1 Tax=Marinicellulosiphila megalodicopiae TaxID=2724896 RepID=UPI003BAFC2C0